MIYVDGVRGELMTSESQRPLKRQIRNEFYFPIEFSRRERGLGRDFYPIGRSSGFCVGVGLGFWKETTVRQLTPRSRETAESFNGDEDQIRFESWKMRSTLKFELRMLVHTLRKM